MRWKLTGAGLLSALLVYLALPPGPFPLLGWLALLPFLGALDGLRPDGRSAMFRLALPFALLLGLLEFRWMQSIAPAADVRFPFLLWLGTILWILYLAVYPVIFARLMVAARGRFGSAALWLAPPLWTLLAWLRSSGILGFSWINLSQTQTAPPGLLAPAAAVGSMGLTFLMVLTSSVLWWSSAQWRLGRRRRALLAPLATGALILAASLPFPQGDIHQIRTAALQGNIALEDKWEANYRSENLRIFTELSGQAAEEGASLLVLPETAFPVNLLHDRRMEEAIRLLASNTEAAVLTGFQGLDPSTEGGYRYRNAAGLFSPNGALEGSYSKIRLLPFGEYIPLAGFFAPGLDIDLGQSNFTAGLAPRVFHVDSTALAVSICYEIGFGGLVRKSVAEGARLLTNITNDGWFEHPIALELHAAQSPMRAAENGLPVVRCANSGITQIIDARGRVTGRLPVGVRDILVADISVPEMPSLYGRTGAWLPQLLLAVYLLVWGLARGRGD